MFILLMRKPWFGEFKGLAKGVARTCTEGRLWADPTAHHTISQCLLMKWGREGFTGKPPTYTVLER